jgi:hypothetical protein
MDMITYRDDSQPLVVKLGNPDLKGSVTSSFTADYTDKTGSNAQWYHVGGKFVYNHRSTAQSVRYNPQSGVMTYMPTNVEGAYSAIGNFDMSGAIDKDRYWTWQTVANATFNHYVDHSMQEGERESGEHATDNLFLKNESYIQYDRNKFYVRATADITWRHSESKITGFSTLNAIDFKYGMAARYTLPRLNTTLSADATMYSRRGYGSSVLNTDEFIVNASVSQPLVKGKLTMRLEAFDLLRQLSNTQYAVNAQGRTETWYRSLPSYVMLHMVYNMNWNNKKGKK